MKSRIKTVLVAGYNYGIFNSSFVGFWFRRLNLRYS